MGEDVRDWKISFAQKDLVDSKLDPNLITPILYRLFDIRYTFYTGHSRGFICMPRTEIMRHMINGNNIALITMRQLALDEAYTHFFTTRCIIDNRTLYSNKGLDYTFPLYIYPDKNQLQLDNGRRPNLNPEFIQAFSKKLGLKFIEDGKGNLTETFGPEDIFNYAYAVFHSPTYRTRYAESLKIDFPRLPLTANKELFKALTEKGAELVALHLMEAPVLNKPITKYPVSGANLVEKLEYKEADQRVFINKEQYFEGVPPEVWNFHVGGYQVCEKWLKDRKGRALSYDDITHYQKVVVSLKETIRLMAEIDQIIPGWPLE